MTVRARRLDVNAEKRQRPVEEGNGRQHHDGGRGAAGVAPDRHHHNPCEGDRRDQAPEDIWIAQGAEKLPHIAAAGCNKHRTGNQKPA